jgi:DNA-binding phage protein
LSVSVEKGFLSQVVLATKLGSDFFYRTLDSLGSPNWRRIW